MSTTTKHHLPPWAKDESCLHNPDKLTPEQVGEGYRLLLPSEVTGKHEHVAHSWDKVSKIWDGPNGVFACFSSITYRVPITVPWPPSPSEGPKTAGEAAFIEERKNLCVLAPDDWEEVLTDLGRKHWEKVAQAAIAYHEASKGRPQPSPQVGMGVGLSQDASIPTPETRVTEPGSDPTWLGATQPASDQDWKSRAESAEAQLASLQTKHDVACQTISQLQNERMHRDSFTALSNLSAWLSQGAGDETTTPDEYEGRIRAGVDHIIGVEVKRREEAEAKLAGAKAHIAALEGQLRELVKRRENDEAKLAATAGGNPTADAQKEEKPTDPLAEVKAAFAAGKRVQCQGIHDVHRFWSDFRGGTPFWEHTGYKWRVHPDDVQKEEKPRTPKFSVGDRVRLLNGGTIGTIQEVIRDKMYQHTQMYDVLWDGVNIAGDHPEYELKLFEWKTSEQPAQRLEDQLASLKSHLVTAELERDRLQSWKDQMLTVESWWSKVDEFIRNHPKAPMGQNVSDIALQWLRAYMEEKSKP